MPFRTTLNIIGGAVNTVTEFYEDVVETVREVTPEPIIQATDYVGDLLEKGFAASPMGIAERGAAVAGKEVTQATGSPLVGGAVEIGLGALIPGGSAPAPKPLIKGAKPITQQAARTAGPTPPMGPQFAMAGAGGPQLSIRGGDVNLQPTVNKLTVTDPEILGKIPNIKPGIGQDELYKKGIQKLRNLQAEGVKKRKKYADQLAGGVINEKQHKARLAKLKKTEDANYSTLGTVEDPDIFEVQSQIQRDPIDPNLPAHQHHAAGKAMTSPWVQQALKLGDDDDVIAFFEFHRALTGSGMGNVKSGIIDMPGFSHIPRDARTPADVPLAVHSFMRKSGADVEIVSSRVQKIIGSPKNMDELMKKYATFADEYLIPQKELSLKRLNQVLTQHRQTLSPKQKKAFDELVSKLNKANTR